MWGVKKLNLIGNYTPLQLKYKQMKFKRVDLRQYNVKRFVSYTNQQGRKRPLDTPKKMIERREREKGRRREREREGEIRESEVKGIKRERVKGRGIERESERKKLERKRRSILKFLVKYPERRSGKQG